jgi:zeaxanthin glucosyltransferase
MRIGFSCPVLPGHMYPMTTLARKVRERGHEVFFLAIPDAEPMVRAAGLEFYPYGDEFFPAGDMARRVRTLSQLSGLRGIRFTLNIFKDTVRAAFDDAERVIRESRADALVLDATSRGLNLVAMHLKVPFIHVSNAMHFDFSGHTPLCLVDAPYRPGSLAFVRNLLTIKAFLLMGSPVTALERAYAEQAGLTINVADPQAHRSRLAQLTQTPKEFDFPSDHWPAHFHHTGPFHDASLRPPIDFPWDKITGEPLIYASMGTLQNGSEQLFNTIAAAAQAPGRQLVLSIGANLDAEKIAPLAANTILVKNAPQLDVLKRAALCITHAGLNTVLESLSAGVPMVAIPITNDQPGVAARIAYTGTGVVLAIKKLTGHAGVKKLRAAIETVLTNPSYRQNAQKIQQAIARTNGLENAAEIIDRTLRDALGLRETEAVPMPVDVAAKRT